MNAGLQTHRVPGGASPRLYRVTKTGLKEGMGLPLFPLWEIIGGLDIDKEIVTPAHDYAALYLGKWRK
jgi:hypothetical protein